MKRVKIRKDVSLKNFTTLKVGGKAKYFTQVKNPDELKKAIDFANTKKLPFFILGGGSDVLVSDEGFPGLVLQYLDKNIEFFDETKEFTKVKAGSGVVWDSLVEESVKVGLQGIECLSGIPGFVGGAPVQNIGAYGQELEDTFEYLSAYDTKVDKIVRLTKKDCKFGYRTSIFKSKEYKGRYIILSVVLKLTKNKKAKVTYDSLKEYLQNKKVQKRDVETIRNAVLAVRKEKLEDPKKNANAGSFFVNPIVTKKLLQNIQKNYPDIPYFKIDPDSYKVFAGWLIEKAGWKGKSMDGAKVSAKNALVITNPQKKANSKNILKLSEMISEDIYAKFGIRLEKEVQCVGFAS